MVRVSAWRKNKEWKVEIPIDLAEAPVGNTLHQCAANVLIKFLLFVECVFNYKVSWKTRHLCGMIRMAKRHVKAKLMMNLFIFQKRNI